MKCVDTIGTILKARQEVLRRCGGVINTAAAPRGRTLSDLSQLGVAIPATERPANPWAAELYDLLPKNFLSTTPYERLPHYPRYLKALQTRIERASLNPAKDQERVRLLAPYLEVVKKFTAQPPSTEAARKNFETFRWMVEEYKSLPLRLQELGTAHPISPKRLDEQKQQF